MGREAKAKFATTSVLHLPAFHLKLWAEILLCDMYTQTQPSTNVPQSVINEDSGCYKG